MTSITIIIILTMLLATSGWVFYLHTLRIIREREEERERFKKAIEYERIRNNEALVKMSEEMKEREENVRAVGKQEGKRTTLEWIKEQVDNGSLEVRVIGSPVQRPDNQ